jgi:hypothetical protein
MLPIFRAGIHRILPITKRKKLNKRFSSANRLFLLGRKQPTWVRSFPVAITWSASLTTGTYHSYFEILLTLIIHYHPPWGSAEFVFFF